MTTSAHPNRATSRRYGKRLIALMVLVPAAALLTAAPSSAGKTKAPETYFVMTMQSATITTVTP